MHKALLLQGSFIHRRHSLKSAELRPNLRIPLGWQKIPRRNDAFRLPLGKDAVKRHTVYWMRVPGRDTDL